MRTFFNKIAEFFVNIFAHPWKSLSIALILALLAFLAFVSIRFSTVLAILLFFPIISAKLAEYWNISPWILSLISICLCIPLIMATRWMLSKNKAIRWRGFALLMALAMSYCLGMFMLTKNDYFSPSTGKAMRYVPVDPTGQVVMSLDDGKVPVYYQTGFCTKTGYSRQALTPALIKQIRERKMRLSKEFRSVQDEPEAAVKEDATVASGSTGPKKVQNDPGSLFDPADGHPLYHYAIFDNKIELWDGPGFHPLTGDKLQPINPKIVMQWESQR